MAASEFPSAVAGERPVFARLWRHHSMTTPPVAVWLPAVLVGLAMALPLAYLVIRSAGATEEVWGSLLRPRTAQVLWRTVQLLVTVTAASVAIAVPLAWLTVRTDLPWRRLWVVVTALPLVIPSYVGAFLVVSALGPKGLLQSMLSGPLGVDRLPDIYGLPGATLTLTLLSYPYVLLTVRGALLNLDPALEESARSLGAGPRGALLRVTLPHLRPSILAGALLVALYTVSDFGAVSLLDYETFTRAIYLKYTALDRGGAAVLSLLLVGMALLILATEARSRGRVRYHRAGAGSPKLAGVVRLGRWKWPAVPFCAAVVFAALVVPVSVLGYWLARGISSGEPLVLLWGAMRNSIYVSGLAALAAALCSIPVAALIVRYPGLLSRVVERLSFTGYALPGIVVALSLVFFGISFARPAYQTVWLLLLAYVVLFFPAALGATRASFLQLSPKLEEAARGLGRTPLQTIVSVTVPQLRAGVVAGAALVFLVTLKELPATLLLAPLEFTTLATAIWSASEEAFFAQAAVPAIMLILMSSVPMAFLMLKDRRARP